MAGLKAGFLIALELMILCLMAACGEDDLSLTSKREESVAEPLIAGASKNEDVSEQASEELSEELSGKAIDKSKEEAIDGSQDTQGVQDINKDMIYVYICGAVESEGVYELPNGSRVIDGLVKAGGLSEGAAQGLVNQAEILYDGEKIYFPYKDEVKNLDTSEILELIYGSKAVSMASESGISGGKAANASGDGCTNETADETADGTFIGWADGLNGGTQTGSRPVNINKADKETLMTLTGIGEKKAEDIIAYREEHGAFSNTEDLMNVSGIGQSTFDKLKSEITTN
ncbi:MAG: helix-hairpin-helix domain-containing protein [Eubacterium sp.]|nr:helix-hairpin-helix domain-containing protein [Eubacterium sp.]